MVYPQVQLAAAGEQLPGHLDELAAQGGDFPLQPARLATDQCYPLQGIIGTTATI